MLGEAGATVYCSGRSTNDAPSRIGRPETIEQTAELVSAAGGYGIAVQTDHSQPEQVAALFERVVRERKQLDLLVNDIGGEDQAVWSRLQDADIDAGFAFLDTAVRTHIITTRYAAPVFAKQGDGLIVEITDGDHWGYRGALFYDLAKTQVMRLAFATDAELAAKGVVALAVTPGFLRSEAMLANFGVTEDNWQDASDSVLGFSESETPCYVGRAVAALAADPNVARFRGQTLASWTLAREYNIRDIDGRQPHWMEFALDSLQKIIDRGRAKGEEEQGWVSAWRVQLRGRPEYAELLAQLDALPRA